MSDLRELYQTTILDHSRQPKNFHKLEDATHQAEGYNPLCGDKVRVYLKVAGDKVTDISFEGVGCAISTASASLMTEALKGKSVAHARALFEKLHATVTGRDDEDTNGHDSVDIGKLAVLEGVRQYPLRVKCATLAWHTLRNAIDGNAEDVVVTE
jgi:nitrogen fixation NifU-like protein